MTAAEELYARVADLAPDRDAAAALEIGRKHERELLDRPPSPHDAETCRLLSLCALAPTIEDNRLADTWRARALARFALVGWHEGVGAVAMGLALGWLARANDDYAAGRTLDVLVGSDDALAALDEVRLFLRVPPSGHTLGPRSPSHEVLRRFVHEKRAFLLLLLGRVDEAREGYAWAAEVARADGNARGEVKSLLGATLVDHAAGEVGRALDETERLAAQSTWTDLSEAAAHNAEVMRRGGRDLLPYEIL